MHIACSRHDHCFHTDESRISPDHVISASFDCENSRGYALNLCIIVVIVRPDQHCCCLRIAAIGPTIRDARIFNIALCPPPCITPNPWLYRGLACCRMQGRIHSARPYRNSPRMHATVSNEGFGNATSSLEGRAEKTKRTSERPHEFADSRHVDKRLG